MRWHERKWSLVSWVVGTDKRERQKANRLARLEEERRANKRSELTRKAASAVVIGLLVFGALYLYSATNSSEDGQIDASSSLETAPIGDNTPDGPVDTTPLVVLDPVVCPAEDGSSEPVKAFATAIPMCIDETATYLAEVVTDKGTVTIELDASRAPNTVNNFVSLARYHFYDGVAFHRIIPGFMIQGGDAVGEPAGTGGPGYQFDDELPQEGDYQIGSVAMANSGPNTQGSQFFIVTGESGVALNPAYSLFGQVVEGLDVVTAIESTGSASGAPSEVSTIQSITITEK